MSLAEDRIMYPDSNSLDDDKRLFVVFSMEARLDKRATADEGIQKYRNVEFITIRIPGDKTLAVHRPVLPADRVRFPLQYAAFKNASGDQIVGTPLGLWPGCSPAQAKELEYFNIRTVEQLASMPDGSTGATMMGIQALRQSAKNFVEFARHQAPLVKVQRELESRDNEIAALRSQIQNLTELTEKVLAKK
jgi:hypothetical protein